MRDAMTEPEVRAKTLGLSKSDWTAVAALVVITVVCHLPVLRAAFAWDDFETLVQNPMVEEQSLLRYFGLRFWRESHPVMQSPYRPVREIALVALWRMGARAAALHAVNLAGHAANAAMVYLIGLALLKRGWAAFAAALVFALHPSHVEVLAFTKNIGEILSLFFTLVCVLCFLRWAKDSEGGRRRREWVCLSVGVAAFALGLLTKETAVAAPFMLTAWALISMKGRPRRAMLAGTAPLWVLAAAYAVLQMRSAEIGVRMDLADTMVPTGLAARGLVICKTVLTYVGLLAMPCRYVPWYQFDIMRDLPGWEAAWICAGVLALAALWLWMLWRWRPGALAVFWMIVALGPASNVVINTGRPLAEQRLYLPSVGFGLLLGAAACLLWARRWSREWTQAIGAALCVVYILAQMNGLVAWRHTRGLWVRGARYSPDMPGPYLNLSDAYVVMGEYGLAGRFAEEAQAKDPRLPGPLMNLGAIQARMGRFEASLKTLRKARKRFPRHAGIENNIGNACYRRFERLQGRGEFKAALKWLNKAKASYEKVLRMNRYTIGAVTNLGNCYLAMSDVDKAIETYERALKMDPQASRALYNLARAYLRRKEPRKALECFEKAAKFNPFLMDVDGTIAALYERFGEFDAAAKARERQIVKLRKLPSRAALLADDLGLYAASLARLGRRDESRRAMEQAAAARRRALDRVIAGGAAPMVRATYWAQYADTLAGLGRGQEAQSALLRAAEAWKKATQDLRSDGAPPVDRSRAWRAYAQTLASMGRRGPAREALTSAGQVWRREIEAPDFKAKPAMVRADERLAWSRILAALGRRDDARRALMAAASDMKQAFDRPEFKKLATMKQAHRRAAYASLCKRLGRKKDADAAFGQAARLWKQAIGEPDFKVRSSGDQAANWAGLARLLEELGRKRGARAAWQQASQFQDAPPDVRDGLKRTGG